MNGLIVDFLALKGLVTGGERDFPGTARVDRIKDKPITREEPDYIRTVFSKPEEETTIE